MTQHESADSQLSADSLACVIQWIDQGRPSEAAPVLQQLIRSQPDHPVALHQLGRIAGQLGMPDRAIRLHRHSLRAGGETPELLNDLGSVFVDTGDLEYARRCFQRCIDQYPTSVLGYVSLAYLENRRGEFDATEALYIAAINNSPQPLEAELNLATLYRDWGRLEQAVELYDRLILKYPDLPLLADGRARALLQQRNWRQGWQAYEARLLLEDEPAKINLSLSIPRWHGESLGGKQLLILHEQGIGDEVQFASCYADAIAQAGHCTITCSPRLHSVFQRSFPAATFVDVAAGQRESWRPPHESTFDYFTPAGSLPRLFRNNDSDFTGKPYLSVSRHAPSLDRLRVGVSWWGGAVADQIEKRSIPFEMFQRLFDVSGVEFVNMQHGYCSEQAKHDLAQIDNLVASQVDPYEELEPWFDLLASLDLLISVDNSNVHFAGALGVPTWLLLPDYPNWRWPMSGETPWYSAVEPIRKTADRDWSPTIEKVVDRLRRFATVNQTKFVA